MLIDLELLREEGLLDAELPDPASDPGKKPTGKKDSGKE